MKIVRLKPLKMPKKNAVKAKDVIKSTPVSTAPKPMKIHGHTTIVLTDPKTGKQEVHEDDNMMTSALEEYFANCGFLNYPNNDQNDMVRELLGGIMGFDTALSEAVDTSGHTLTKVPAGVNMTFNGSILNTTLASGVTEIGTYVADQSGWKDDGSFVQTYDFSMEQGNGTIACVCLCGKNYGYAGEGNKASKQRLSTKYSISNLCGTVTAHSGIPGYVFNVDLEGSTVHSFSLETVDGVKKGFLRQYRLPISIINVKGTRTAPILMSETEVTLDDQIKSANLLAQSLGDKLVLWNIHIQHGGPKWGTNWTQYIWELTTDGTLTKETIENTSGSSDLYGLQAAIFDGDYVFFVTAYGWGEAFSNDVTVDSRKVYILKRSTGAITTIDNPSGVLAHGGQYGNWTQARHLAGWLLYHSTGDGRIVTYGGDYSMMVDAVAENPTTHVAGVVYPTNSSNATIGNLEPVDKLIRHVGANLYRDQGYIATINNLSTPVVKDNTRTMRVIYRLTFEEEEE